MCQIYIIGLLPDPDPTFDCLSPRPKDLCLCAPPSQTTAATAETRTSAGKGVCTVVTLLLLLRGGLLRPTAAGPASPLPPCPAAADAPPSPRMRVWRCRPCYCCSRPYKSKDMCAEMSSLAPGLGRRPRTEGEFESGPAAQQAGGGGQAAGQEGLGGGVRVWVRAEASKAGAGGRPGGARYGVQVESSTTTTTRLCLAAVHAW